MAFGINRDELEMWKRKVQNNEIAFLTHYWLDDRFPQCHTVTKVGCHDVRKLIHWGNKYGLDARWIDYHKDYPHFDLFGNKQIDILIAEGKEEHIIKFDLKKLKKDVKGSTPS